MLDGNNLTHLKVFKKKYFKVLAPISNFIRTSFWSRANVNILQYLDEGDSEVVRGGVEPLDGGDHTGVVH